MPKNASHWDLSELIPRNQLIRRQLQFRYRPLRYKIPGRVRYKIPSFLIILCSLGLSRSRWALRYKMTSSVTATPWQLRDGRFCGMVLRVLSSLHE